MLSNRVYSLQMFLFQRILGLEKRKLQKIFHEDEESPQIENEDLVDILLKVYQDDKAEFKINRTHLKAFLLVSHLCFCLCFSFSTSLLHD